MLTDYQRKVLRILYNYKGVRRVFPTIHDLMNKTGKDQPDVMAALDVLIAERYIQWDDKPDTANIVILEGWEREGDKPQIPKAPERSNDVRYWTDY
ncbi:hypothetical protein MHH92_23355 [Paenibacillus sp. FSL M7-1414]|uniref:hypothetical protein n=1 Tax=Paenibacillus sp. FSL M7-1414 TaxID=2921542 RepID=UPI0030FC08E9